MTNPTRTASELLKADLDELKLPLMDVDFVDLNLQYRGEGNENLVFSMLDVSMLKSYIMRSVIQTLLDSILE